MHPTAVGIKSLVDKKLPPGDGTIGVQTFLAHQLTFHPEIKRYMGVDIKLRSLRSSRDPARPNSFEPPLLPARYPPPGRTALLSPLYNSLSRRRRPPDAPVRQDHYLDRRHGM